MFFVLGRIRIQSSSFFRSFPLVSEGSETKRNNKDKEKRKPNKKAEDAAIQLVVFLWPKGSSRQKEVHKHRFVRFTLKSTNIGSFVLL